MNNPLNICFKIYMNTIMKNHIYNFMKIHMNITMNIHVNINPFKPKVWDGNLSPGGGAKRHPLEIKQGAPWDLRLLKVILKPIKVMITYKNLGPYLKNLTRYWDLKILR